VGNKDCVGHTRKTGFFGTIKSYMDRNRLGELLVLKGLISPAQLREALTIQKEQQMPLGYVLVKNNQISKRQLQRILLRQRATRFALALVMCLMSFSFGAPKKSMAAGIKDVASTVSVAQPRAEFQRAAYYPNLFGSTEKRSGNLTAFTKWSGMFQRFEASLQKGQTQELTQWRAELSRFKNLSLSQMASKVNDLANEQRYIVDQKNWGTSDYWATPIEFLRRGGDCEDFAIAKYAALRMLGVPEERLRVAIVHDTMKNIPHAVLVVYTEQGPVFLDNQIKSVTDASTQTRYRPIFSINRTAWWLHKADQAETRMASAR